MSRYGFFLFGSYLTLLGQVESFVLLTANYDDLKRIAQKFVPEVVVDKIADFLTRATNGFEGANISKENEENYEHKKKASRDRESKTEDSKDSDGSEDSELESHDVVTSKNLVSIDSIQLASLENFRNKERKVANDKKRKKKLRAESNSSEDSNPKNVYYPKEKKSSKLLKVKNDDSDLSEERKNMSNSKSVTTGLDFSDQKDSVENVKEIYDNFDKYQEGSAENNIHAKSKSEYAKEIKSYKNKVKSKRKYFKSIKSNKEKERSRLTTRVERNEFDQYDNKNYPKSKYVLAGTSGPLALTMVQ